MASPHGEAPSRGAPCVLIVDDEVHIRHVVGWKLRQLGCEVIDAPNGNVGLELAIASKPDLVISDYQMPIMDGLEFCVRLAAEPATAEIPVIMLTGRGHRVDTVRLATTSVQHLLSKPFSPTDLIEKVMSTLHIEASEIATPDSDAPTGASAA